MKYIMLVILLVISGCANDMIEIPISAMTSEESRMKAYSVIGDASTAKEAIVHKSWQVYHKEYEDAYEMSGFTMEFKPAEGTPGAVILTKISFKPEPKMTPPPAAPSEHPVWKTANKVLDKGIMWAGLGYIAHEFRGMQEAAYDAAGTTYNGPTNIKGSYNTAGNDNYVTMQGGQNTTTGVESYQDSSGCPGGDCGGEEEGKSLVPEGCGEGAFFEDETWWIEPGCSCESRAAGHC